MLNIYQMVCKPRVFEWNEDENIPDDKLEYAQLFLEHRLRQKEEIEVNRSKQVQKEKVEQLAACENDDFTLEVFDKIKPFLLCSVCSDVFTTP